LQSKNTAYLERLDHLRAFAAFCVVLFEFKNAVQLPFAQPWLPIPLIERGQVGVSLFMVISGFILSHIAAGGEIDVPRFYLNRVLRIYPLFTFIIALGYFVTPDPRSSGVGLDFLLALLPISNLYRLHYGVYGGMMWTIAVELQFYLLFPIIWRALRAHGVAAGIVLIGFALGVRALAFLLTGAVYDLGYFSLFGSIDAFLIGCMTQLIFSRMPKKMPSWLPLLALIVVGFIAKGELISINTSFGWIVWPTILPLAFAALIVTYLSARRGVPGGRFFAFAGRVSFSIYAWQYVVFGAVNGIVRRFPIDGHFDPYLLGLLVAVLGVLPVAVASYYVIEKPFLDMRVRYLIPKILPSTLQSPAEHRRG
jgi:peptidoglycan/LPS O-acetylase OafA/YrhL